MPPTTRSKKYVAKDPVSSPTTTIPVFLTDKYIKIAECDSVITFLLQVERFFKGFEEGLVKMSKAGFSEESQLLMV